MILLKCCLTVRQLIASIGRYLLLKNSFQILYLCLLIVQNSAFPNSSAVIFGLVSFLSFRGTFFSSLLAFRMDFSRTPPASYSYFCFYCLRIGLWVRSWGGATQMVFHCREAVLLYWVMLFTQCPRNLWLASVYINATSYLWGFQVTKLLLLSWSCDCVCLFPFSLSVPPPCLFFPLPLPLFSPPLPSFLLIIIGADPLKTQGHVGSREAAQS